MMGRPILLVTDGGLGETPVPADALFQPGETIVAAHTSDPTKPLDVVCIAVVPVGACVEYAIADQAKPQQRRPLTLRVRRPHKETLYVLQWPNEDEPMLHTQSDILRGQQKAAFVTAACRNDDHTKCTSKKCQCQCGHIAERH
jgi:hypothetical protein